MSETRHIKCPICCWNRTTVSKDRNGVLKELSYSNFDVEKDHFVVSFKGLGRAKGFEINESESLTLEKSKGDSKYKNLINELKQKCEEILEILKDD